MRSDSDNFTFSDNDLLQCDAIAQECLGVVIRRRLYPKLKSALYESHTFGEYLLVCIDKSVLFTPKEIGIEALVAAFKNGLRSNREAVQKKTENALNVLD